MCRAFYSNCRGVSIPSHGLCVPCEGQVYLFDWKPCERTQTRSVCEPTFHPNPAGDVSQCEECEEIERKPNQRSLIEKKSSMYHRLLCPSRGHPSYAPPPYVSPPPYFGSSTSSIAGSSRPTIASTYLQPPPSTQFAESPYAEILPRRRYAAEEYCGPAAQEQPSSSSRSLHSSASDKSRNTRAAAVNTNNIEQVSLLHLPPMPIFPESPYIGTQRMATSTNMEPQPPMPVFPESPYIGTTLRMATSTNMESQPPMPVFPESPYIGTTQRIATSTNRESQPIQSLPPVAQPLNYRRLDGYKSHEEEESPLEPRALDLRSQWYENELQAGHEQQHSSTWNTFSGWIRKAGERITGQGRSNQNLSRSRQLARQPRVKPQRRGIEAWVASSNFDRGAE